MRKVLDLFACEGGASWGYAQAGLSLLAAADLDGRALRNHWGYEEGLTWEGDWRAALNEFGEQADLVHASPPCQRYTDGLTPAQREAHPDLVGPVRRALRDLGKPYVIENVENAPLKNPVFLTGCMFGLTVTWDIPKTKVRKILGLKDQFYWETVGGRAGVLGSVTDEPVTFHLERRRGFEVSGFSVTVPEVDEAVHSLPALTVVSGTPTGFWNQWYAQTIPAEVKKELMGSPWMTGHGVAESIPPVYAEYIGQCFLESC
jgi:DNA (cytosine-5)-methyltransferase 1